MPPRKLKPAWIAGTIIILILGAIATDRLLEKGNGKNRPERERRPIPVEVAEVQHGSLSLLRTFSGAIEPRAQFTVAPKVSGRIRRLHVDVSDPVSRGQLVAELEDGEFRQALVEAEARLAVAEANRVEAASHLEIAQRQLVRTRNGLLPKLDLFIDLGKTGYAESFGSSVNNLDDDNYELAAGIRFSTYLGRRESEGRDLVARASREQAVAAIENLRSLVELDVRLAVNETERTRRQIEASAVTRQLQAQTLEAEQEKFSIGTSTSLLVAQAQRDLLLSELAEIEAVVDYRIALVNLFLAEGSLLERRGGRLPAAD